MVFASNTFVSKIVGRGIIRQEHARGVAVDGRRHVDPGRALWRRVDGVMLSLDVDLRPFPDRPAELDAPAVSIRTLLKQSSGWLSADARMGINSGRAPGTIIPQKRAMWGAVGSGGRVTLIAVHIYDKGHYRI